MSGPMSGYVYLVGAGPGDPELITVKALRALERADVVLYDALANPALLGHCKESARLYDVGKLGFKEQTPQEVTERLLVEAASAGHVVVRLKGGDPFVFGRGGEEAIALARAGIPYEVVPGVSSAVAGPAAAHIPVTQRGVSSMVTFVTGSAMKGGEYSERWRHLAAAGGTLVFLMAVRNLEKVTRALIAGGLDEETPAATIERATLPSERTTVSTLRDIARRAREVGVAAPAVFVVGDVVHLRRELLLQHAEGTHVSLQ